MLQTRLTLGRLRSPAAGAANAFGAATGPSRRRAAVVTHRFKLANAGVDRASAHAQHLGHIGDPAATNLQRLDRRVATPVILWQGGIEQPHEIFVLVTVTGKLAHQPTHKVPCVVAIVSLGVLPLNTLTFFCNLLGEIY